MERMISVDAKIQVPSCCQGRQSRKTSLWWGWWAEQKLPRSFLTPPRTPKTSNESLDCDVHSIHYKRGRSHCLPVGVPD